MSTQLSRRADDVYRTGKTAELHEIPVTLTGRLRYFNLTYSARRDDSGNINGIMILGTEVTNEVMNRSELQKARRIAEVANQSKTHFLANMSHEIRTPLGAIVGFSDLLGRHVTQDKEANVYIDRISRNARILGRLIDELLDLSKIEADKLEIERIPVDVNALLEDVHSTVHLRAEEKGLKLSFNWCTQKPKYISTDPVRLAQILTNVIGNAVKFTERGSITVEFHASASDFRVMVSDTGIGLTIEQQSRIFEPFTQADASVTRKFGGTGLGLALSKRLAGLLGGDLRLVRSAPNEGTAFDLSIKATPTTIGKQAVSKTSKQEFSPNPLSNKRILIVDDSPDNRTIVGLFLKQAGATTEDATNGEEALSKVQSSTYDLVLMDIQMPTMDGYQAMLELKKRNFQVPVIAVTAHALKDERDRCIAVGFRDYITKPVNRRSLVSCICEILEIEPVQGSGLG